MTWNWGSIFNKKEDRVARCNSHIRNFATWKLKNEDLPNECWPWLHSSLCSVISIKRFIFWDQIWRGLQSKMSIQLQKLLCLHQNLIPKVWVSIIFMATKNRDLLIKCMSWLLSSLCSVISIQRFVFGSNLMWFAYQNV